MDYIKYSYRKNIEKNAPGNIYIADCYAYDKRSCYDSESGTRQYQIKITDGSYYIKKWFDISFIQYDLENIHVKLYISYEADIFNIELDERDLSDILNIYNKKYKKI